jgi:hypothetical protein
VPAQKNLHFNFRNAFVDDGVTYTSCTLTYTSVCDLQNTVLVGQAAQKWYSYFRNKTAQLSLRFHTHKTVVPYSLIYKHTTNVYLIHHAIILCVNASRYHGYHKTLEGTYTVSSRSQPGKELAWALTDACSGRSKNFPGFSHQQEERFSSLTHRL